MLINNSKKSKKKQKCCSTNTHRNTNYDTKNKLFTIKVQASFEKFVWETTKPTCLTDSNSNHTKYYIIKSLPRNDRPGPHENIF